jgi:prophage regulatory protein
MPPDQDQLLTVTDVLNVTGFKSRTTIYRRVRKGSFPCPYHIGAGKIRWRSADVEEWLNGLQPRRY